jgi:hypothetical protein
MTIQEEDLHALRQISEFLDSETGKSHKGYFDSRQGWAGSQLKQLIVKLKVDKQRITDEQIVRILTRLSCGCLALDCVAHGSYDPADMTCLSRIIGSGKLFP